MKKTIFLLVLVIGAGCFFFVSNQKKVSPRIKFIQENVCGAGYQVPLARDAARETLKIITKDMSKDEIKFRYVEQVMKSLKNNAQTIFDIEVACNGADEDMGGELFERKAREAIAQFDNFYERFKAADTDSLLDVAQDKNPTE